MSTAISTPLPLTMSIIDSARFISMHPNSVRRMVKSGALPSTRYGTKILVLVSDLIEFQTAQEQRTVATIQSLAAGEPASGSD